MAELDKINVNGELYDMSDSKARSDIASEITNRTNADATLQTNIDNEANARTSADNALNQKIVQETTNRTNADNALQEKINTNKTGIDNLVNDVAIRNVKAEEVTNVPEVKLPLDEVKEEIEAAGNRVLNSIPDDYTQINNKIGELKSDLADIVSYKGNILTRLIPEKKVISTSGGEIIFYDNENMDTFFVPVNVGEKYYLVSKSGFIGSVRRAFVDTSRNGSSDTYVIDAITETPIEFTATEKGYFLVCVEPTNTNNLSVSKGNVDTKDYYLLVRDNIKLVQNQINQTLDECTEYVFSSSVKNKKLHALGDSITYGYTVAGKNEDGSWIGANVSKKWWEFVAERYGMSATSDAEIGRAFTKDGSMSTRFTQRVQEIPTDSDVIIVFGGTNDFNWSPNIGSIDDTSSNENGNISFYSALKFVAEYLSTNFYDKTIIFMTPLPRKNTEGFNGKDVNGKMLIDYAEAITKMCRCYGFYCIDLNNICDFYVYSDAWLETYMVDGLHPNDLGTKIYVEKGIYPALDKIFRPMIVR